MSKKMYKYEMHLHTSEGSACGMSKTVDMVQSYIDAGFDGMVITDHFFNGNCAVSNDLPWKQRVTAFFNAYDIAVVYAKDKDFDVLLGWEYSKYAGSHMTTYGLDKDFIYDNEDILDWSVHKYVKKVQEAGGIVCQAHPYREAVYIDEIKIYPDIVDAVEVINAHNKDPEYDRKAKVLADEYKLIPMIGSDAHSVDYKKLGMEFDHRIVDNKDLVATLKSMKP